MAFITADRVQETTATVGTGPLTLAGAFAADGGSRSFASQMSVADTCEYCIKDAVAGAWEVGIGTYSAVNTLTRTTVQSSSNANAAVSLAGNAATAVFLTLPASRVALIATRAPLNGPLFTGPVTITDTSTNSTNNLTLSAVSDTNGVNIRLIGNGATTPNKTMRVLNGNLEILNNAYSVVLFQLGDLGDLLISGKLSHPTPAPGDNTTNSATTAFVTAAVSSATIIPVTKIASATGTQTLAFPASGNAAFDLTLTGATTIVLSGGTAGQLQTITLLARQDATAGRVLTLPTGVRWPGGTAPTPGVAAGGVDVFMFTTPDARTTVIGSY